jgi:hypothetical protein
MIMENPKKQSKVDLVWQELTSVCPPLPKAQFMGAKIETPIPFLGTRKQITFRRHHPMEHSIGPDEPNLAKDDWTRQHD